MRDVLAEGKPTGMALLYLTLTAPGDRDHLPDVRRLCRRFAVEMEDRGGGVVLVLERENGRWHAHGLGIAEDRTRALARWLDVSGAKEAANEVVKVTGQAGEWDCFANSNLRRSMKHILDYAIKGVPTGELRRRLVLSGPFKGAAPWAPAAVLHPHTQNPRAGRSRLLKASTHCHYCGEPLPPDLRKDALYCPRPRGCRTMAWRKSGAVPKASVATPTKPTSPLASTPKLTAPACQSSHPIVARVCQLLGARVADVGECSGATWTGVIATLIIDKTTTTQIATR